MYIHSLVQVEQVTVVWSDPDNKPPPHLGPDAYPHREVFYEIHETNSITNRFRALNPVPTDVRNDIPILYPLYLWRIVCAGRPFRGWRRATPLQFTEESTSYMGLEFRVLFALISKLISIVDSSIFYSARWSDSPRACTHSTLNLEPKGTWNGSTRGGMAHTVLCLRKHAFCTKNIWLIFLR